MTMNAPVEMIRRGYDYIFQNTANMVFGSCETLYSCDTYQFSDYDKYYAGMFSEPHKAAHRDRQFPVDMRKAYELGKRVCV